MIKHSAFSYHDSVICVWLILICNCLSVALNDFKERFNKISVQFFDGFSNELFFEGNNEINYDGDIDVKSSKSFAFCIKVANFQNFFDFLVIESYRFLDLRVNKKISKSL